MNNQFIPVFEPSGNGLTYDFMQIKKNEMIVSGWYKGKIHKLFTEIAGQTTVNNIRCYNKSFDIGTSTCPSSGGSRAKKIKELFRLLGYSDDTLNSICKARTSKGVSSVYHDFREQYKYEESDFELTFGILKDLISDVHSIKIFSNSFTYPDSTPEIERVCPDLEYNQFQKQADVEPLYSTKFYDSLGIDITSNYIEDIVLAVQDVILISGLNFIDNVSSVKTNEEFLIDGTTETGYYRLDCEYSYVKSFSSNFVDEYEKYSYIKSYIDSEDIEIAYSLVEDTNNSEYMINRFWYLRDDSILNGSFSSEYKINPIFYSSKIGLASRDIYLRVDGVKKSSPNILAYGLAQFSHIGIKTKDSGFLGIGGFIGNIFSGLVNAVVSLVSAFAGIIYELPILRTSSQILMYFISGGKWTTNKDEFKAKYVRITLFVVAVIVALYGQYHLAIAILSIAISAITLALDFNDMNESFEEKRRQEIEAKTKEEKDKNKEEENKTIELNSDIEAVNNYMYEGIYDSYSDIDNIYSNPYDKNGMFDSVFNTKY